MCIKPCPIFKGRINNHRHLMGFLWGYNGFQMIRSWENDGQIRLENLSLLSTGLGSVKKIADISGGYMKLIAFNAPWRGWCWRFCQVFSVSVCVSRIFSVRALIKHCRWLSRLLRMNPQSASGKWFPFPMHLRMCDIVYARFCCVISYHMYMKMFHTVSWFQNICFLIHLQDVKQLIYI